MKLLVTILFVLQYISISSTVENYDTRCFDTSFPSAREETESKSSGATIDVRVVHRRKWSGTTGTMDKVVKNNIYTIFENSKAQYGYEYNPLPRNPDYNPRILTLLFDGNSTSVQAAIGHLDEEASKKNSARWVGCSNAVLTETHPTSTLTFETNLRDYINQGIFGSGSETLELSLVQATTTTRRSTTTANRNMAPIVTSNVNFLFVIFVSLLFL